MSNFRFFLYWIIIVGIILYTVVSGNAIEIGDNVVLGGNTGFFDGGLSLTSVTMDSSVVNFIGFNSSYECWREVGGGNFFNVENCSVAVGSDNLFILDFNNASSNITLLNQTGNLSIYSFQYNSSGAGQINLFRMQNLSGECNYGFTNLTGRSIVAIKFPLNTSRLYNNCDVTVFINSSTQNNVWADMKIDSGLSYLSLAGAIAGLSIVYLYKRYQWD